ncbi:hypothetical protein GCM10022214_31750 [Actinomadura miaoliensis]|uniref:DUF222 domain-containing protein n=1 Tax=Actinomadura miaoliensis TaxID=430685 RepID=A0ABP7VRW1_9ACTN
MGTPFPPGFSGIDPDLMTDMIKEFRRGRADITGALASYRSRLPALGVDVSPLSSVDRVCAWIDEQLPMLTRRKDLAVALDDSSERGFASIDESLILSPADARRQGAALAARFKGIRPGDGAYHDALNELGMHRFDAEYAAAFFAALGPELTRRLPSLIKEHGRKGHASRQIQETSQAFGSAVSGGMDVPGFNTVAKAMFDPKISKEDRRGVASLAAHGTFPPEWLASLARLHALDPAYRHLSSGLPARSDLTGTDWETIREMLRALSNNPAAARLAFQGTAEAHPRQSDKPPQERPYLLPSKPEPDLGHVISTFTRLSVFRPPGRRAVRPGARGGIRRVRREGRRPLSGGRTLRVHRDDHAPGQGAQRPADPHVTDRRLVRHRDRRGCQHGRPKPGHRLRKGEDVYARAETDVQPQPSGHVRLHQDLR